MDPTENTDLEKLPEQRLRFLKEYLVDFNGAQAAIRAGYSEKSAKAIAWEILQDPTIAAVVAQVRNPKRQDLVEGVRAQARITSERTQRAMAGAAYFNIKDYVREDGSWKNLSELTDEQAEAIAGAEIVESWVGEGESRKRVVTTRPKFVSKLAALEMAARITGEFAKDNAQRRPARDLSEQEILDRIAELMRGGDGAEDGAPAGETLQ